VIVVSWHHQSWISTLYHDGVLVNFGLRIINAIMNDRIAGYAPQSEAQMSNTTAHLFALIRP
jgi:hypothetical protein